MNRDALLACSTFPEIEMARRIAQQLVTENLAACANLIPAVESIYRWQDKIENAQEVLGLFKTTAACYGAFQERLQALHPYDVPEYTELPIEAGGSKYLDWIAASVEVPA